MKLIFKKALFAYFIIFVHSAFCDDQYVAKFSLVINAKDQINPQWLYKVSELSDAEDHTVLNLSVQMPANYSVVGLKQNKTNFYNYDFPIKMPVSRFKVEIIEGDNSVISTSHLVVRIEFLESKLILNKECHKLINAAFTKTDGPKKWFSLYCYETTEKKVFVEIKNLLDPSVKKILAVDLTNDKIIQHDVLSISRRAIASPVAVAEVVPEAKKIFKLYVATNYSDMDKSNNFPSLGLRLRNEFKKENLNLDNRFQFDIFSFDHKVFKSNQYLELGTNAYLDSAKISFHNNYLTPSLGLSYRYLDYSSHSPLSLASLNILLPVMVKNFLKITPQYSLVSTKSDFASHGISSEISFERMNLDLEYTNNNYTNGSNQTIRAKRWSVGIGHNF